MWNFSVKMALNDLWFLVRSSRSRVNRQISRFPLNNFASERKDNSFTWFEPGTAATPHHWTAICEADRGRSFHPRSTVPGTNGSREPSHSSSGERDLRLVMVVIFQNSPVLLTPTLCPYDQLLPFRPELADLFVFMSLCFSPGNQSGCGTFCLWRHFFCQI